VADDDGRARAHPPGPGHPGGRRPDRGARNGARVLRPRGAGLLSAGPTAPWRASPIRRCTTFVRWPG
jgi:hypothetical protein